VQRQIRSGNVAQFQLAAGALADLEPGEFADEVREFRGAIGAGVEIRVGLGDELPHRPSVYHSPSGSMARMAATISGMALAGAV